MAESKCDKDQPVLKQQGSFVCTSGVLLWGTLDNILEAKTKLDDNRYDGQPKPDDDNDFYQDRDENNFKCRAAKGQWIRYTTTVDGARCRKKKRNRGKQFRDNGRIGLFCHADSMTPDQLMELGRKVRSRKLKKVSKDHAGFAWKPEAYYEAISNVVLTDPTWSMTVPEYYGECIALSYFDKKEWLEDHDTPAEEKDCSCDDCNHCCYKVDCEECEGTGRNYEKFLVDKMKAKFDKGDRAFMLKDANDQVCGIMCEEPKEMGADGVCARLIFNGNKELIGMKYQEMDIRSKSNDSRYGSDSFECSDPEEYYNLDFLSHGH